ncbi:MAG TPA: TetR/AcrR family transcriptional regulator [Rhizomicrobium sp.]|jgi:AcrR family transcriptional regulator|nr:TetR/AcrR family transcriptional regulator [Rhizomicrobium sp.]
MPKPEEFQRRRPKQARALATCDSILEAAIQILQRCGADGLNTNSVAERAGVSVGTLYQYFPDKDAILLAAARRELARPDASLVAPQKSLMEALVRALEALLGGGVARAARPARSLRVAAKRGHKPGANAVASLVEDFVLRWIVPPLLLPKPVRAMPSVTS